MYRGEIAKMQVTYADPIQYNFIINNEQVALNELIGSSVKINWSGKVVCSCGKIMPKFYRQNFCYKCFWSSPLASQSIFKPELCKADLGIEERDLEWEKKFQIAPHYVYLSNSSGLKVGITRKGQKLTRWIDQGASQAILLAEVPNRRLSGLIEVELKKSIADKTNWRKMLSGVPDLLNMLDEKFRCTSLISSEMKKYLSKDNTVTSIHYPVNVYPQKIKSLSLQKTALIEGVIEGIKGQYILLDNNRVFNVRSHQGFIINFLF
ncbi:MAG: DUF2797 domain-containing protein [Flavobacteriales bacterium TMED191]|nr:MAG: DUF2797 domain-containing protein [Flavobacteriales bacterium TMED191]